MHQNLPTTETLCLLDEEGCWRAVLARSRAADGRFVMGVLSTGIYCRPSCPARHPLRGNVRFFADGAAAERLGMSPSAWARGGRGATIRWGVAQTALGPMLLAATEKGVCRLSFHEGREELARRFPEAALIEGGEEFEALLGAVLAAVEAPEAAAAIPLDVRGTAFQEAVWQALRRIPPGETRSYAEIAAAAGHPGATRAAGSANGANPVAVLIPCHRVIRGDGTLGGYAWGLEIKRALLEGERQGFKG